MYTKEPKIRISLTEREVVWLAHIMDHFSDYMAHDDRPDHGLGILSGYRDLPEEQRHGIFFLTGKLLRVRKKLRERRDKEDV